MGKSRQTGKLSSDGIFYADITNSRVGIGTTIPTQTLDIRGSLRVTGGLYDSNNVVGAAGSVLISTGIGVSWSASAGSGGQGVQGTQGVGSQGTQGTQGTQGIQGDQGIQGIQGLSNQGVQGTQGVGSQGLQGTQGLQGNQGTQGVQGNQGTQGVGSQGTQGVSGGTEPWVVKTANYTAVNRDKIIADTIGSELQPGNPFTITLPASPSTGDSIRIAVGGPSGGWSSNNVTIGGNGSNIESVASNLVLSNSDGIFEFVYQNNTIGWQYYSLVLQGTQGIQGFGSQGSQGIQGVGSQGLQGTQGVGSQGSQGTQGASAATAITNNTNDYVVTATGNSNTPFNGEANLTFDGTTLKSPILESTQSSGSEGGEIKLNKPASSTSINTGVTIDIYENKVRIFETGGSNRGGYWDVTALGVGVTTNLLSGGAGGATGPTGAQGSQGTQGVIGSQGSQGLQGVIGSQGSQGLQGFVGTGGSQGSQGTQGVGSQGLQGTQGFTGGSGGQGSQGTQGVGSQGLQGTQGFTGGSGGQGSQGTQGVGSQGLQGTQGGGGQGLQGALGAQGPAGGGEGGGGAQGTQGTSGEYAGQGVQGTQGSSASADKASYRIVSQEGQTVFTAAHDSDDLVEVYLNGSRLDSTEYSAPGGTSVTFTTGVSLNDIVNIVVTSISKYGGQGVQGVQGVQGYQGVQGLNGLFAGQGLQGLQGLQGHQGTQGLQGLQGLQGTQGTSGLLGGITYNVSNSGSTVYVINGSNNPTLQLVRGMTYYFVINAVGYRFWFQTVAGAYTGVNNYTTGVTNSGTASGTIVFSVPLNAPSTLYYVSQDSASMTGPINIVDLASQGIQGTQGVQGTQGMQGSQGVSGSQGFQGVQGINGLFAGQGVQGLIGTATGVVDVLETMLFT